MVSSLYAFWLIFIRAWYVSNQKRPQTTLWCKCDPVPAPFHKCKYIWDRHRKEQWNSFVKKSYYIYIYVRDFALVCVPYVSLCVTSQVTLCPWPVRLGFWGVYLLLFSSQSLGYFPECGPLRKLWGFISFLPPCLWLSITTLDNSCVRILFLLSWGKQLSFSVRY